MIEENYKIILNVFSGSKSKLFLENYWLHENELQSFWLSIKNSIFDPNAKDLPDLMFNKGFELLAQRGGALFSEKEYCLLQDCMKVAGDKYFVFIECEFARNAEGHFPYLRFKFPIDTTWEELNNGDENFPDIAFETIFIMSKHFFVFGDSGKWGKYAASDYLYTPLDIIGFKPELSSIFKKHFTQSKEEWDEIKEWLPQKYKKLIKQ